MFLRSISEIDDYDMVSHNRRGKDIYTTNDTFNFLIFISLYEIFVYNTIGNIYVKGFENTYLHFAELSKLNVVVMLYFDYLCFICFILYYFQCTIICVYYFKIIVPSLNPFCSFDAETKLLTLFNLNH